MKRVLAGVFLLGVSAAGVYGYTLSERERSYRQAVAEGDAALARDNTGAAIEAFSGAITLKADSMVGYLKRGQTYRRRGEFAAAIRDLRRASEIDPSATLPLEELGDAYLADTPHRYEAAAGRFQEYVKLDNRAPRVLYKLAFARYNFGRAAEAIDPLQRAIALDERFAEAYYLLGLCHRDVQHPELAQRALDRAVELQPTLLHAREELADLYGAQGKTASRLAELERLNVLDPGVSRAVTLGLALARAGQPNRAVVTLAGAAETYPDYPYAYVALGRVWLEIAQAANDRVALSKAIEALEGAVGSDDSSEALTLFGRALLMTSDEVTAERMLQDATQKQPVEPLAFYYLSDAAERLGHYAIARRALLDYEILRGDEPDARRRTGHAVRLGELSLRLNDPSAAATYFLRAAGDSDGPLLARAADAQLKAGDREAARATAIKALEKDPKNAVALTVRRRLAGAVAGSPAYKSKA
ncbi:MAG TPA: tetratricopeptide repeat protein [Burkholderiales bacterium]|nr:tetratricopeptide repeat protein [Burkholderiales bacterium]